MTITGPRHSFLRLVRDVKNPKPDRRKGSWEYSPVWTAGTLLVRCDWTESVWGGDDKPDVPLAVFDLRPVGGQTYGRVCGKYEEERGACRLLMEASEAVDLDEMTPNNAALAIITAENVRSDAILRILIERGAKASDLLKALSNRDTFDSPLFGGSPS